MTISLPRGKKSRPTMVSKHSTFLRIETDNDNLRQVDRITANGGEGLLELVDDLNQVDVHVG